MDLFSNPLFFLAMVLVAILIGWALRHFSHPSTPTVVVASSPAPAAQTPPAAPPAPASGPQVVIHKGLVNSCGGNLGLAAYIQLGSSTAFGDPSRYLAAGTGSVTGPNTPNQIQIGPLWYTDLLAAGAAFNGPQFLADNNINAIAG